MTWYTPEIEQKKQQQQYVYLPFLGLGLEFSIRGFDYGGIHMELFPIIVSA